MLTPSAEAHNLNAELVVHEFARLLAELEALRLELLAELEALRLELLAFRDDWIAATEHIEASGDLPAAAGGARCS